MDNLVLTFSYYGAVASAFVTGLLTLMSILSLYRIEPDLRDDMEKAKNAFYIFSALCLANSAVAFILSLDQPASLTHYPKVLASGLIVETLFLSMVLRSMARAIKKAFDGD